MNGTIQKWGNSHAVRLPKAVLSAARFQENDLVAFSAEENRIVITKLCRRHRTLKERLASAPVQLQAGKEAPVFEEWNTGEPSEGEAL
ncbi:AbrB/MazE/SpoVT family DNA-binding domain-containing protein [Synergistes jonesii]|uniref:AbrB/MazE/SpoVT family DNA-binding domain-containing protein n=1 Tax=Synergistes jonesii TaxID=2754 RepID=UPI00242CD072|nr:AbrB/MazE/SpoVT family DNA-binding domain-containing protein [Synergistes jonesii]